MQDNLIFATLGPEKNHNLCEPLYRPESHLLATAPQPALWPLIGRIYLILESQTLMPSWP